MQYFRSLNTFLTQIISLLGLLIAVVGCNTVEVKEETPPSIPVSKSPTPAVLSGPAPSSLEAKTLAQKLAQIEALDLLQKGEEAEAQKLLERSLVLDPGNELARKLLDQIGSDAQLEYGPVSFPYTVQVNDTLGKLAQKYLNDQYRFYILAKYNDMKVPNKLAVGQTIRIPGVKKPEPKSSPPPAPPKETPPPAPPKVISPPPPVTPPQVDPAKQQAQIKQLLREAESAYRKQDLDIAIHKWDQVLALTPDNVQVKQKRDHARQLKDKLKDKFDK